MERILVVLPNWFGETLFATPFLRSLREQRPGGFIATLGWPQCREILLHNPDVNLLLDYDERGVHRTLAGKWRLIGELRSHRFDAAFILRKSLSRSLLLRLAGIPERIGFDNPKSGWLLTRRVAAPRGARHKAATYFPLLACAGLSVPSAPVCHYAVSEEERRAARERLGDLTAQPVVILHPGANWPHKRWAPDRFAALGDRLALAGARIVITGAPEDGLLADAVTQRMRQRASVLAGQTSVRELGACLEQARLVVSNDTGILHIAAALGRPLVALYGPTSPVLTGPLGDARRMAVLHHPDCCPQIPCYHPRHPSHPGMDAISVEEASAAAARLLDASSS